jgi:hypothetical protein
VLVDVTTATVEALADCDTIAPLLPTDFQRTIAMTNSKPPDDAKETTHQAFSIAQDTAQNALYTGGKYMRENRILVILGAVLFGAALGAFFASKRRKEPDAVQAVRDWLEKTLEEFSKQWPKAKKQARSIQDDLVAQAQGVSKKLHFWSR